MNYKRITEKDHNLLIKEVLAKKFGEKIPASKVKDIIKYVGKYMHDEGSEDFKNAYAIEFSKRVKFPAMLGEYKLVGSPKAEGHFVVVVYNVGGKDVKLQVYPLEAACGQGITSPLYYDEDNEGELLYTIPKYHEYRDGTLEEIIEEFQRNSKPEPTYDAKYARDLKKSISEIAQDFGLDYDLIKTTQYGDVEFKNLSGKGKTCKRVKINPGYGIDMIWSEGDGSGSGRGEVITKAPWHKLKDISPKGLLEVISELLGKGHRG